ncbi:putative periplasmic lipoprotein [Evansella halocellulosilytica]|uniref:hypothetical protein n=1 Tax=Evansella halocellulosilytica TaxID=2011013 RepID=UPI000BB69BCE|nr:hypothetical protein [Evansella halocellulosilytica]
MKRWEYLLVLLIGMALVGCSSKEGETIVVTETNEEVRDGENDEQPEIKPLGLGLSIDGTLYKSLLFTYCWEGGEKECSKLSSAEQVLENRGERPIFVSEGEQIQLMESLDPSGSLPPADSMTIIETETGEAHTISDSETFTAPEENGAYYYKIHAQWDDSAKEEAIYLFELDVR